jgi:amino acid transporter
LLSILGVIMYLRLGWVVGRVGLGGALIIIVLSNLVTLFTALSMSSVITNIRIGAGGAYSIITKSLGLEAGGAIGVPLYFSQAISVAFYITGFAECWRFVFPGHSLVGVSLAAWVVLLVVSYLSAKLAFRIQYGIMFLIALSIVSLFLGEVQADVHFSVWKGFSQEHFWGTFAIFFPAATGILAGAAMSGELKDPKRSIPLGTLGAIGVGFLLYCLLAYRYAKQVPLGELVANSAIALDMGRWRIPVIAGIMGATISSALNMFVGAPRILKALGKNSILPFSSVFRAENKRSEPANAILVTALISLITILLGSLDNIASLLTMFFLITYGMINFTVFIEQTMGIASFRPSFKVNRIIPLAGAVGCVLMMFLINMKFSLVAIVLIIILYVFLSQKEIDGYSPDIRSGLLVFLAEKFAKAANTLPYYPKIWKPNLLVPVYDPNDVQRLVPYVRDIVFPSGRITFVNISVINGLQKPEAPTDEDERIQREVLTLSRQELKGDLSKEVGKLRDEGLFVETSVVEVQDVLEGTRTVIQTVGGMFFPPNTFFYVLDPSRAEDERSQKIIESARDEGMGIIILRSYFHQSQDNAPQPKRVNLWIRKKSPNINLAILTAIQLERNGEGAICLLQVVSSAEEVEEARQYLTRLKALMRLSSGVAIEVLVGDFKETLKSAPAAEINIFGVQARFDIALVREVFALVNTTVLFLGDSQHESALA